MKPLGISAVLNVIIFRNAPSCILKDKVVFAKTFWYLESKLWPNNNLRHQLFSMVAIVYEAC